MKRVIKSQSKKLAVFVGAGSALTWLLCSPLAQSAGADNVYKPETMAHLQKGVKFLREHQVPKAIEEFNLVVKAEPNVPDAYNNLGLAYAYQNDTANAQKYYRKALDLDPLNANALNNLGLVLYSGGKAAEALSCWQRCLEVSREKDPILYYYIANALRDTGKKDEAREYYVTAIRLKDDNAAAYSGLAALDLREGRLEDALREVKKSIKLKPDSAFSYYHLGLIEEKLGDKKEALNAYQTSLRYESVSKYANETRARINALSGAMAENSSGPSAEARARAQSALARQDYADAARDFEALAHGDAANDAIVWNNLGLSLAGTSQNARAVEAYKKALSLRRDGFAEAQYNLGMVLRRMGDNGGAAEAFEAAIKDSKKKYYPLAQNMLGIIKRERGDFEGADRAFKLAISQSSDGLPVVHFNRALLLEHTENTRDAITEYKTYLSRSPKGKNAESARIRLRRLTGT